MSGLHSMVCSPEGVLSVTLKWQIGRRRAAARPVDAATREFLSIIDMVGMEGMWGGCVEGTFVRGDGDCDVWRGQCIRGGRAVLYSERGGERGETSFFLGCNSASFSLQPARTLDVPNTGPTRCPLLRWTDRRTEHAARIGRGDCSIDCTPVKRQQ